LLILSYIAHSSVLPKTALSASQSKGTAPAAHTTLQMQSQYLHPPPQTQTVVADIHPPPAAFADTPACTSTHVPTTAPFPLVEHLPPIPTRVTEIPQAVPVLTAGTTVPLPQTIPFPAHCHPQPSPVQPLREVGAQPNNDASIYNFSSSQFLTCRSPRISMKLAGVPYIFLLDTGAES